MRSYGVVRSTPPFDAGLSLLQRIEDFAIEQIIPHLAIEALDVTVLPGAARLDKQRPDRQPAQPLAHPPSGELGAIVRANMRRNPPCVEQASERVDPIRMSELAGDTAVQALAAEFIDDVQDAVGGAVMGSVLGSGVPLTDNRFSQ